MRMFLRRVIWKRDPSADELFEVALATMFGPVACFRRGREWLFLRCNGILIPDAQDGFELISLSNLKDHHP